MGVKHKRPRSRENRVCVQAHVPFKLHAELCAVAEREGVSMAIIIDRMLRFGLASESARSIYDRMAALEADVDQLRRSGRA